MDDKKFLFYGDCLVVLRRHVRDPRLPRRGPSTARLATTSCSRSTERAQPAQIHAFEDRWHWDENAAEAFRQTVELVGTTRKSCRHS